ncbi:MAG: hypothetical protein JSV27_03610 [Candidatus Bathyarchaeota archaeon]|nr:MAG: hypothetical protein JSV27_03610 [Candidatus Bathyarchaeota archaeon]
MEGSYVETEEGLIFSVKGLHHPEGMIIAYLRYVPDPEGDRRRGPSKYRRVYDLDETQGFLEAHYPQYLNHVEERGLLLQSVPLDRIVKVYTPRDGIQPVLESPRTELEKTSAKFASAISSESGVPPGEMGVSGSLLLGLARAASDVDLIVYGVNNGFKAHEAIRRLREGSGWVKPYDTVGAEKIAAERWGGTGIDLRVFVHAESCKVLHGLVDGREYFVRLVRRPEEYDIGLASRAIGRVKLRATVTRAEECIFTPCTYLLGDCEYIEPEEGPFVTQLNSYRGKFTEQASEGEVVEVYGSLEEVRSKDGILHRVMLGGRGDYLVPVSLLDR